MTPSTIEAPASAGGGLPTPPSTSATVTVTERRGARVTVSTWNTCLGVSAFVSAFLGEPTARAETAPPACCRCDPSVCATDETGDHCVTAGCAWCINGCPAVDETRCCQEEP